MPLFAYTILYVQDVQKTIHFYTKALGFQQKFISPQKDYAELISGSTTLAFASTSLAKSNLSNGFSQSSLTQKPFGIEIGFTTTDIQQTLTTASKAGAIVIENPKTKPWGQTVAYLRDPDGFLIEICTPINPS